MGQRREIRSIDPISAVRMTFAVGLAVFAILLVGVVALYLLGLVSGGLGGVEGFIASLGFTGFRFTILPFIVVFIVVSILLAALLALAAGIAALLYNHIQPLVGGVTVTERDR